MSATTKFKKLEMYKMEMNDHKSIELAHIRIDYLERDFLEMKSSLQTISEHQAKQTSNLNKILWMVCGGVAFYVLNAVGLVEFIKSVV